jgi:hypothetical protein
MDDKPYTVHSDTRITLSPLARLAKANGMTETEMAKHLLQLDVDGLSCLAAGARGRGSALGLRVPAGELASSATGSLVLFRGGFVQRGRGAHGGSNC